jgi:hypothetical protein
MNPALTRTIDTLQRIYAVIAALAIGQALSKSFLKGPEGTLLIHWGDPQVPLAIACIVTVIPFVHGMNRHLDKHAARLKDGPGKDWMMILLSLDFIVFVLECCILLMLGTSVTEVSPTGATAPNLRFLTVLGILLSMDAVWSSCATTGKRDSHLEMAPGERDRHRRPAGDHAA